MQRMFMTSKNKNEIKQSKGVCGDLDVDAEESDESSDDVNDKDDDYENKDNFDSRGNHSDQNVLFLTCRVRSDSPVRERERGSFSFYQVSCSNFQNQTLIHQKSMF